MAYTPPNLLDAHRGDRIELYRRADPDNPIAAAIVTKMYGNKTTVIRIVAERVGLGTEMHFWARTGRRLGSDDVFGRIGSPEGSTP